MDLSSGEGLSDPVNNEDDCLMMMMSSHLNDQDLVKPNNFGQIICFGNSEFETKNPKFQKELVNNKSKMMVRSTSSKENVLAERRRREKMNLGFHALSNLIPGLTKKDKASILTNATEYIKQLEEQAKLLEKQTTKRLVESVYLVKRFQNQHLKYDDHSFNEKTVISSDDLLEIQARFLNNNILIRVHSLKKIGIVQKILEEIGKLSLTTLNCLTTPFGTYAIDVTIVAQVNDTFRMTSEDLVRHLEKVLR